MATRSEELRRSGTIFAS